MNIIQLSAIAYFTQHSNTHATRNHKEGVNIILQLNLILTVGCSDPNLHQVLKNVQSSLEFIEQWFYILIIFAIVNILVDFGLPLTYGNTYSNFFRKSYRCICCKTCRRKIKKRIGKKDDNQYQNLNDAELLDLNNNLE